MSEPTNDLVVKVGGEALVPGPALGQLVVWTARQVRRGRRIVLVHGGGDEITDRASALGLVTEKRDGQRVTSPEMLNVVVEVLAGRLNLRLTNALESAGVPAVGLAGVSAKLLVVRPAGNPPGSLGWVGEPRTARVRLLTKLLDDGLTPVVAPVGTDGDGGVFNVNADLAAGAVAAGLRAELILLTDVPAVRGPTGDPLGEVSVSDVRRLIGEGTAREGMIPKLTAAIRALSEGASQVWIGDLASLADEGPLPGTGTRVGGSSKSIALTVPPLSRTRRDA